MTLLFPTRRKVLAMLPRLDSKSVSDAVQRYAEWKSLFKSGRAPEVALLAASELLSTLTWCGPARENHLLSALAGVPVRTAESNGVKVFLASSTGVADAALANYFSTNHADFGIHSLGWEGVPTLRSHAMDSLALYSAGKEIVKHGNFDALVCEGVECVDAGLRIKKETGAKAVFVARHSSFEGAPHWALAGIESRLVAALGRADGVVVQDEADVPRFARLASGDFAAEFSLVERASRLESRKRELRAVMEVAKVSEKKELISAISELDGWLSNLAESHGPFHVRTKRIAVVSPSLGLNVRGSIEDIASARRQLLSLPVVSGSASPRRTLAYAYLDGASDAAVASLVKAFAMLPKEVGLVAHAKGRSAEALARAANASGVGDRVSITMASDALHMAASQAIVFPAGVSHSTLGEAFSACAIAENAGSGNGPVILVAGKDPRRALVVNSVLGDLESNFEKAAGALDAALHGVESRARLKAGVSHALGREWTARAEAEQFAALAASV